MAVTKRVKADWAAQPKTNFNWENNSDCLNSDGCQKIVEDIIENWEYEVLTKWNSFKRSRAKEGRRLDQDCCQRRTLIKYLKNILETPVFDFWADFYYTLSDKGQKIGFYRSRLMALVRFLLYVVGESPKPDEKSCNEAESVVGESTYGFHHHRTLVVSNKGRQPQTPTSSIDSIQ